MEPLEVNEPLVVPAPPVVGPGIDHSYAVSIDTMKMMYVETRDELNPVKYLLTYKLSQDHLELFFSSVRRYGSWYNNVSACQFGNAYRALLSHAGVSISSSVKTNCISQDVTSVLTVDKAENPQPVLTFTDALCDHIYTPNIVKLSTFIEGILDYIAGWVVRKVSNAVHCSDLRQSISSVSFINLSGWLFTDKR